MGRSDSYHLMGSEYPEIMYSIFDLERFDSGEIQTEMERKIPQAAAGAKQE